MNIKECFAQAKSKSDVCRLMEIPINGTSMRKINDLIFVNDIDVSHFDNGRSKHVKYEVVSKSCPVCGDKFETQKNHPKEKQTCSYSCSNTYFRSGNENPNWKDGKGTHYRRLCFRHYDKKCLLCGWNKVVQVHHIDKDRLNNNIENLVPLCPNHHAMCHTKRFGKKMLTKIKKILSGISHEA